MTTPFMCLFIMIVLVYVIAGIGVYFRSQQLGSIDAEHPRVQALELRDVAARAYAAHQNAWEALAVFTVAVVVNHLAGADPGLAATTSVVFLVARVGHAAAYIANKPILRTLSFLVGIVSCVTLLGSAIAT